MNYVEEEHYRALEEEQDAQEQPCKYAKATGDARYPTLCEKDDRYAKAGYCETCPRRTT